MNLDEIHEKYEAALEAELAEANAQGYRLLDSNADAEYHRDLKQYFQERYKELKKDTLTSSVP